MPRCRSSLDTSMQCSIFCDDGQFIDDASNCDSDSPLDDTSKNHEYIRVGYGGGDSEREGTSGEKLESSPSHIL